MFPPRKQYCALSREPTQADRSSIYRSLCKYGKFTGLWWILSPEPEPVTLPMLTIEEIIYSDGFLQAHGKEDQLSFFKEKCKIQSSTIDRFHVTSHHFRSVILVYHFRLRNPRNFSTIIIPTSKMDSKE